MNDNVSSSLSTTGLLYWVEQLLLGHPDAAEPEFRKILAKVEKLARKMFRKFQRVGRFVDVEDVIQNTLVRLLAALRTVRPTSTRHFYALANELIRRELLDLAKRYYGPHGAGTNLTSVSVAEAEAGRTPEDQASTAELEWVAAFHEAVAGLSVEQREVIGLTYYHGWSQAEIADLFQVSVRTVQRWDKDARAALKALFRTD